MRREEFASAIVNPKWRGFYSLVVEIMYVSILVNSYILNSV